MSSNTPCTYFMLLKATRHWRELDHDAQRAELDRALMTVFNGYPELRMSRYAATAFHGRCTDVIVWEAHDASQYNAAIDALHDEPFFGAPLFEIVEVIPGLEDDGCEVRTGPLPFEVSVL